jgi:hypothetical protein
MSNSEAVIGVQVEPRQTKLLSKVFSSYEVDIFLPGLNKVQSRRKQSEVIIIDRSMVIAGTWLSPSRRRVRRTACTPWSACPRRSCGTSTFGTGPRRGRPGKPPLAWRRPDGSSSPCPPTPAASGARTLTRASNKDNTNDNQLII